MNLYHALEQLGILLSGVIFYSYAYSWLPASTTRHHYRRVAVLGLGFGALSAAMMVTRIELAPGVYVDARTTPPALIGLFEGWRAGLLAALPPAVYRLWLGGSGAWPGVFIVIAAGLGGALVHAWAHRAGRLGLHHALALSGLVFLTSFGGFAMLGARGIALFERIWFWYLVVLVVGIGFVARLFRDVAEQKRLAAERERFRAILDEATDVIRILDPDTELILDTNRADSELSGYSREEIIGRSARDFWPEDPARRPRHEAILAEARSKGVARAFAVGYRTRSGEVIPIDVTHRLVPYQGRHYEIAIGRDARERLAAEVDRREAAELRAATLTARAAAHEINNPLTVIMAYLQMLERRSAGGEEAKWLREGLLATGRIRDAVSRLNRIIRIETTRPAGAAPPMLDSRRSAAPGTAAPPPAESSPGAPASAGS